MRIVTAIVIQVIIVKAIFIVVRKVIFKEKPATKLIAFATGMSIWVMLHFVINLASQSTKGTPTPLLALLCFAGMIYLVCGKKGAEDAK